MGGGRHPLALVGPCANALEELQHVAERGEIVQRDVARARRLERKVLPELAEKLGLLDAVDAQVRLEVGVQLDDLGRVARLLDHEVDQEALELAGAGRLDCGRRDARDHRGRLRRHPRGRRGHGRRGRGVRGQRGGPRPCGRTRRTRDAKRSRLRRLGHGRPSKRRTRSGRLRGRRRSCLRGQLAPAPHPLPPAGSGVEMDDFSLRDGLRREAGRLAVRCAGNVERQTHVRTSFDQCVTKNLVAAAGDPGHRLPIRGLARERARLDGQFHGRWIFRHQGRRLREPHARRHVLLLKRKDGLDESRHARGRPRVANLAGHGPQQHGPRASLASVDGCHGLGFLGVELRPAHAGRLHQDHVLGGRAAALEGPARGQPGGMGPRRARAGPHPAHDAVHRVAVALGVGQALEQEHAAAFAGHGAVGAGVEGGPRRARRQQPAQRPGLELRDDHVLLGPHADHHVARPARQQIDAAVQRGQRGGHAGVEGHAPAHQVEDLRDPRGQRAGGETAGLVQQRRHVLEEHLFILAADALDLRFRHAAAAQGLGQGLPEPGEVQAHHHLHGEIAPEGGPDHDANPPPVHAPHVQPRPLERLVHGLEDHEVQRAGLGDLLGRDRVFTPIVLEVAHEAAQLRRRAPGPDDPGPAEDVGIPAVRRDVALRIAARHQHVPVGRQRQRAGQHHAHADDRHRLVAARACGRRRGRPRQLACLHCGWRGRQELVEHEVHVQSADAERVDAGPPRGAVGPTLPGHLLQGHEQRRGVPVDLRIEPPAVGQRRDHALLHGEHGLGHAGQAGGLQRVAEVGLDAPHRDLATGRDLTFEHGRQGLGLGGVAHLRRGGMGLDVLQPVDSHLRAVGAANGLDLALLARRPEALAAPVGRDPHARDHRANAVLVGQRAIQRLEDHGHVALGHDQPVGLRVEGPRSGIAHRLGLGEGHQGVGVEVGGPAHDRHVDPPELQRPHRLHHRLGRAGAGRVEDHLRPAEPERLGDQGRGEMGGNEGTAVETALRTGAAHGLDDLGDQGVGKALGQPVERGHLAKVVRGLRHVHGVHHLAGQAAGPRVPHVHSGVAEGQMGRVEARIAASGGGDLAQRQVGPVVRGDRRVREGAKAAVDGRVVDQPAQPRVRLAAHAALRVEQQLGVEAVGRDRAPRRGPPTHQLPQGAQVGGPGQAAGHAEDRNRGVCPG